jgi:hypothetical protein
VTLADRDREVSWYGAERSVRADAGGRFVFQNVAPGDYRVSIRAASAVPAAPTGPVPAGSPRPATPAAAPVLDLFGETRVAITGQDVAGLAVQLGPASTISGQLAFAGTTVRPPADASIVQVLFRPVSAVAGALSNPGGGSGPMHSAVVSRDGTFRVAGLPPDRYLVSASWPGMRTGDGADGWWLTAVRLGSRDVSDRPIDVGAHDNVTDVTLEFRDRIGALEGTLTDGGGGAAPAYFVLAFPVERDSWTTTSRRVVAPVQTGTDGRYRIVGLLPGEYYLAVVTEAAPEDTADPEFLASIVPGAVRVRIAAGEVTRRDLRIK